MLDFLSIEGLEIKWEILTLPWQLETDLFAHPEVFSYGKKLGDILGTVWSFHSWGPMTD